MNTPISSVSVVVRKINSANLRRNVAALPSSSLSSSLSATASSLLPLVVGVMEVVVVVSLELVDLKHRLVRRKATSRRIRSKTEDTYILLYKAK